MFADDLAQEARKHSETANNHKPNTKQQASVEAEPLPYSDWACRMRWTARESEIMARVWSEMNKPLLTKSVREALEAEGERAAEALANYSRKA
jgi:hypothetical protein